MFETKNHGKSAVPIHQITNRAGILQAPNPICFPIIPTNNHKSKPLPTYPIKNPIIPLLRHEGFPENTHNNYEIYIRKVVQNILGILLE